MRTFNAILVNLFKYNSLIELGATTAITQFKLNTCYINKYNFKFTFILHNSNKKTIVKLNK